MIGFREGSLLLAGLLGLAMGVGCACAAEGEAKPEEAESKMDIGSAGKLLASNAKSIPLSSIVTTSPQRGMLHVKDVFLKKEGVQSSAATNDYWQQFFGGAQGGASNAFLVDAMDARSAIDASSRVFVGMLSADTPISVNKPDPPQGNHWLVTYLGVGPSDPTWWKVESVKIDGGKVTLTYRMLRLSPCTLNFHSYYYWIPLGKLAPGTYEINLFDAKLGATTLMRRVEVTPSMKKGRTQ